MQLKTGRKAWKISKTRFSQTVRNHCEFRNELATQFRIAKSNSPSTLYLAKLASHKTYAKFRIAKICNEFANQFRNAKISQCQIRNANFAMPISQCQIQFRNAKFNFAMPISNSQCQYTVHLSHNQSHCEISHCEIHNPLCEFRKPISHCQIHCLCEIHIYRPCHPL